MQEVTELRTCPQCLGNIQELDDFCGHCGHELKHEASSLSDDIFEILRPTLTYYFITLVLLTTYKLTSAFPPGLDGMLIVSIIDIVVVLIFWYIDRERLTPLFSFTDLKFNILLLTIAGAIAGSIIISFVADFINLTIQDDVFYSTDLFEETAHPFLYASLVIAVQPAIFEEVAFRGFLFNNLKQVSKASSAIYVSGFLFGIMHLAFISLLWLVPIGLAFAFLRNKYNTLWYGIIGHFVYNLCIVGFEFLRWP
jgi:membrane protease YdiL (CAAX protease family)